MLLKPQRKSMKKQQIVFPVLDCPHCSKTFTGQHAPQGKSGHMRIHHGYVKGKPPKGGAKNVEKKEKKLPPEREVVELPEMEEFVKDVSEDNIVIVENSAKTALNASPLKQARTFLGAAIEALMERKRAIKQERDAITIQRDAINGQLGVLEDEELVLEAELNDYKALQEKLTPPPQPPLAHVNHAVVGQTHSAVTGGRKEE